MYPLPLLLFFLPPPELLPLPPLLPPLLPELPVSLPVPQAHGQIGFFQVLNVHFLAPF